MNQWVNSISLNDDYYSTGTTEMTNNSTPSYYNSGNNSSNPGYYNYNPSDEEIKKNVDFWSKQDMGVSAQKQTTPTKKADAKKPATPKEDPKTKPEPPATANFFEQNKWTLIIGVGGLLVLYVFLNRKKK